MLPVTLKVAKTDAGIQQTELDAIQRFFVDEWGYSPAFVAKMVSEYREQLDEVSFAKLSASLHEYCRDSKDCDQDAIIRDFILHLREIIEADGVITEEEKRKIDYISGVLVAPQDKSVLDSIKNTVSEGVSTGTTGIKDLSRSVVKGGSQAAAAIGQKTSATARLAADKGVAIGRSVKGLIGRAGSILSSDSAKKKHN